MSTPRYRSAPPSRSGSAISVSNATTPSSPGRNSFTACNLPGPVRSTLARVSRGVAHRVTFIPGDGTGPEIAEATRRVLEATGVDLEWDVQQAGADVMDEHGGNPLPDHVLESIKRNGTAIKGPITTPVGTGFRSVNVGLRKSLDLYGQVRPCKSYPGVRSRYDTVDLVVIRENTEDLYAGIEFEEGSDEARELVDWLERRSQARVRQDSGLSLKPISVSGTRRIVEFAFDYARSNGRRKVTAVHKANIMKFTDGLFLQVAREVAAENEDVEFEDRIVDNISMQLVQRPEEYDVADRLEEAVAAVIAEGSSVTYDMKPTRDDPTAVGTSQVADAIIEAVENASHFPRV